MPYARRVTEMADGTAIDYVDASWPVVAGCSRVSPGCTNCFAVRHSWRLAHNSNPAVSRPYQGTVEQRGDRLDWTGTVRCLPERLDWPLRWRSPRRIFVCNMADLFHPAVPNEFIDDVWDVMHECQHHTFLILTKRPERMWAWYNWATGANPGDPNWMWRDNHLSNIWLGVTCENQEQADRRIPILLQVPAAVRWVSIEPMLGPVDLSRWLEPDCPACDATGIGIPQLGTGCPVCQGTGAIPTLSWVVVGGETGPGARPLHPYWVRSVRDQCVAAGVPFWFKQRGEWTWDMPTGRALTSCRETMLVRGGILWRVGSRAAGALLDGREWREVPGGRHGDD